MQLKKKMAADKLASSCYTTDGLALRLSQDDDRYMNSVAVLETVGGEIRLVIFDDSIDRYGIKICHEKINPEMW